MFDLDRYIRRGSGTMSDNGRKNVKKKLNRDRAMSVSRKCRTGCSTNLSYHFGV